MLPYVLMAGTHLGELMDLVKIQRKKVQLLKNHPTGFVQTVSDTLTRPVTGTG